MLCTLNHLYITCLKTNLHILFFIRESVHSVTELTYSIGTIPVFQLQQINLTAHADKDLVGTYHLRIVFADLTYCASEPDNNSLHH